MDRANPAGKINAAVQQGLAACRHSVAQLVALAEFLDDLRAHNRWTSDEIQQVEAAIRHVLARLVE
jgi:hypothetical protein